MAAHAAVQLLAQRIGHGLAGQVDFDGRVDRHQVVMLGDHPRVVGIVGGIHLDPRIIVQEAEQGMGARGKAAHDFPLVQGLALAGDHALRHQMHHAVREHLGVDAQVLPIAQRPEDRVRQMTDSHLERIAVGDQRRDVPGNPLGDCIGVGHDRPFQKRLVVFHQEMDVAHGQEAVAQRARHVRIHLGDQGLGGQGRRKRHVHRDPQAAKPLLVRRADHDQRHVDRDAAGAEHGGNLREEDGRIVGAALADRFAETVTDEKRVGPEPLGVPEFGIRRDAHRQDVHQFRVLGVVAAFHQRADQSLRFAARRSDKDAIARLDLLHRERSGHQFLPPCFTPIGGHRQSLSPCFGNRRSDPSDGCSCSSA
jgi:hypothetical protein